MSPRHRFGTAMAAPTVPAGSFVDRFIAEHTADPWGIPEGVYARMSDAETASSRLQAERMAATADMWRRSVYSVRAGALYDRYVDEAEAHEDARTLAPGEAVLSHRDFGLLLTERGYAKERDEDGHVYYGLTLETRPERADSSARGWVRRWMRDRVEAEAKARHMAEVSHIKRQPYAFGRSHFEEDVEVPCDHQAPENIPGLGTWSVPVWVAEARRLVDEVIAADPTTYEAEVERVRAMYDEYMTANPGGTPT